jgi:hypothetical protein
MDAVENQVVPMGIYRYAAVRLLDGADIDDEGEIAQCDGARVAQADRVAGGGVTPFGLGDLYIQIGDFLQQLVDGVGLIDHLLVQPFVDFLGLVV